MKRLTLLCLLLLCLPSAALAAEELVYRGAHTLIEDTVWDGPVLVDGILTVAAGVTLEIRPGSRIRFTRFDSNGDGIGEHEIFSQGTIRAIGTAERPVIFTSAEDSPRRGDWGAINMMVNEEDNYLEHCVVEYGYRGFHAHFSRARLTSSLFRENQRGAQFQESQVVIDGCRFIDNTNGVQFRDSRVTLKQTQISGGHWGLRTVYSDLRMEDCVVTDNLVNGVNLRDSTLDASGNRISGNRRGLYLQRSKGRVVANILADNSEHGIFLEDSEVEVRGNRVTGNGRAGMRWLNSRGRLSGNLVAENGEYALINDGANDIDARGNWWGASAAAAIAETVRDGSDRPGLGLVDVREALPQPPPLIELPERP